MRQLLVAIPIFAVAASGAPAEVVQVDLPGHVLWCKGLAVSNERALESREEQQALFQRAEEAIAQCARSKGAAGIGIPFVQDFTRGTDTPEAARITLCAVVPDGSPACSGIATRRVGSMRVLAGVCRQEESARCKTEIETALKGDPWKLDDSALERIQWRFAQASGSASSSSVIIDALTGMHLQLVSSAQAGAMPMAERFVVVAVPVPLPPADRVDRR